MNSTALICVTVLGLLLFGLGLAVSSLRFQERTGIGCQADPTNRLHKLVRAHGNTAEYAPFLAVLFLYAGTHRPSGLTIALIVAATVCRCLVVVGLVAWPSMNKSNPARFVGALGTYFVGAALSIAIWF